MENNLRIAFSGLSIAFVLLSTLHLASAETIDEMIVGASDMIDGLDFMADLSGDVVRQELDMMLTKEQYLALQELETVKSDADLSTLSRKKRKALKNLSQRWTNNVIPYKIARNVFRSRDLTEIRRAMEEWQENTCIRFREAGSRDSNYVEFDNGQGCYSYVGMIGGAQTIGLARGCRHKGIIAHEIGHAVGFHHEQNRPDRDEHVIIQRENIPSNLYYNFKKYPWSAVSTYDVPYDYRSVMHYGGKAFSNNGQYTIKTIDPAFQSVIGNRKGLSFFDIKLANFMYNCHDGCKGIKCPGQGFVGQDCKCYCPGSPIKVCDSTGTQVTDRPTVATTQPTVEVSCRDMNDNCPRWAKSSFMYCQNNAYVKTYCKKSCGTCEVKPTTAAPCMDLKKHCNYWKRRGFCTGLFEVFMTENCAKSCNVCRRANDCTSGQSDTNGRCVSRQEKELEENGTKGRYANLAVISGFGMLVSFYHLL